MTTTVRSVRVEMELGIARYVANATTVGRVTENMADRIKRGSIQANIGLRNLDSSTGDLAKTSAEAKIQQAGLSDGIDRTGRSAGRAESSIDKYSGRLKTVLGLVQVLAPAALRLVAGALPAVSASIAGIGAGAGGIGVTLLALHGVNDALKALNDYELERTPENLRKVQQAFAEIGPEGAHFVQTLRDLGPEIDQLQQLARAGVLPGFEDSIDSLTTRLPIVSQIVNRLSREVGRLSADAGDALASDEWTPFFEYVRATAAPTLDDFARSTGNVALGLANILVAFDPLTRSFTSGLEDMTSRFARWSQGLEDDEGFQAFLDEVREAGPEVLDFLGSTIDLMAGLARSSAPLAETTLPILTGIVKVLGAIANSPLGPTIYTAATAWTIYSRAALLAEKTTQRVQSSWSQMGKGAIAGRAAAGVGLLAAALTDYDDKAGLANATTLGLVTTLGGAGPLGIAAGITVGLLIDIAQADDDLADATERAKSAINSADTSQMREQLQLLRGEIEETEAASSPNRFAPGGDASGIGDTIDFLGSAWSKLSGAQDEAKDTASEVEHAISRQRPVIASTVAVVGDLVNGYESAAAGAQQLSNALAVLNGWFDKRDAIRGYKDAIDGIAEGLKDGFSREDVGNIDAAGRSILQVANLIQNPKRRADFLGDARDQLQDLADREGPRAAAALQKVIDKFDSENLTHPPPIKLSVEDQAAEAAFARTRRSMADLDHSTAEPKVQVDPGNSFQLLGGIQSALSRIVSKTITVTVNKVGGALTGLYGADGMTVPGPRSPYADKTLIMAAPGEEIISNRHGQADRFRSDRAAGRIPGYASGGMVDTYTKRQTQQAGFPYTWPGDSGHGGQADQGIQLFVAGAWSAAKALKALESAADKVQRSYEKEKSKLDSLISSRSSLASSIASSAVHDPFGNGLAGLDSQVEADTADIDAMSKALATLVGNGLDPKSALYQELAASMDVNTAQQLAALSAADLASRATRFQHRADEAGALGATVAGQEFNEAIRESTKETRELKQEMRGLKNAMHDMREHMPKEIGKETKKGAHEGSRSGSEEGTKAGNNGRSGAASAVATQSRPLTHRGRGPR